MDKIGVFMCESVCIDTRLNQSYGFAVCKLLYDKNEFFIDFVIVEGNDFFASMFGISKADLLKKKWSELTDTLPRDKDFFSNLFTHIKSKKIFQWKLFSQALKMKFQIDFIPGLSGELFLYSFEIQIEETAKNSSEFEKDYLTHLLDSVLILKNNEKDSDSKALKNLIKISQAKRFVVFKNELL